MAGFRDVNFEWTALNQEFIVGAEGSLSQPFVGDFRATGVTSQDLARQIGNRLMEQMGLRRQPDVIVEILQFPYIAECRAGPNCVIDVLFRASRWLPHVDGGC
ncbi:polysaccharide biosynthesis/export family protein [Mesorhizobium sp. WSM2239]|uniref:Polysaccharide biosynthesis/export family protein n=2 Tax=unclassified Mesorhizobium TaxID=325217 RepID=A0AAU8DHN2_9HYPH